MQIQLDVEVEQITVKQQNLWKHLAEGIFLESESSLKTRSPIPTTSLVGKVSPEDWALFL